MTKRTKAKSKEFDNDRWLTKHFEEIVDKFAGEFIVVAEGQIYRGGTPSQLRDKAQAEHPKVTLLAIRVPRPEDFICALVEL